MDSKLFLLKAQSLVAEYSNSVNEEQIRLEEVYVVWSNKILQNNKAMLSTDIPDGRYYEVTYNGDKKETYIDAYVKESNKLVKDK